MITEIGITAGEVWKFLDEKGGYHPLAEVIKHESSKKDLALMALGWLCREGHVAMTRESGKVFVELTKKTLSGKNAY